MTRNSMRMTRRELVKLAALSMIAVPVNTALAGCSSSQDTAKAPAQKTGDASRADDSQTTASAASSESTSQADAAQPVSNVLVAYFSATGNTERAALAIADQLGADTFVITPKQPYSRDELNYNDSTSRVCKEHDDPDRHVELEEVTPEGLDAYETVFVGYPTWWQHASWVMDDFVTGNDFTGKRIIPFTTSAASPLGESASVLADLADTGDWEEGVRFSSSVRDDEVRDWVESLGL